MIRPIGILGLVLLWASLEHSLGAAQTPPRPAPGITWNVAERTASARIEDWPLNRVLNALADATGWDILVEPGLDRVVSTRFEHLPTSDALRRLLGELNFALLARTNAPNELFIYSTSVQDATQRIRPSRDPNAPSEKSGPIPNELIVFLKPGDRDSIDRIAAMLGAKVVGRLDTEGAYRLQFESEEAATRARGLLENMDEVRSVENNFTITPPAQLSPLSASSLPPLSLRAKKVPDDGRIIVGLIDTAVQPASAHLKDFILPGISIAGTSMTDPHQPSHGTSMAETILRAVSIASDDSSGSTVRILPVDVYGSRSTTTSYEVAAGIYTAAQQGADVINLSLGSDSPSPFLQKMVEEAHSQGIVLVSAAGNAPLTLPTFPAAYPQVVAVTSGDKSGRIAPYANRGAFVDAIAPGASIVYFNDQAYMGVGTSYSSAYISGVAAVFAAEGQKGPAVESSIREQFAPPTPKGN